MHALLQIKHGNCDGIAEFLEHCRNHDAAITNRIGGNHHKRELPGQAHSRKAVVETGMRDRRRVLLANFVENKKQRSEDQNTPNAANPEDDLGEFHKASAYITFAGGAAPPSSNFAPPRPTPCQTTTPYSTH